MPNIPDRLFPDSEVIDLCNSIIDIDRALKALGQFMVEVECLPSSKGAENAFVIWGLRTLVERFLTHQNMQLAKIMDIYKAEADKIIRRTERR